MGFEVYNFPAGKIMIAHSDENYSVGTLELNPKRELQSITGRLSSRFFRYVGLAC